MILTDTDDKKHAQIMRGVLIDLLEKAMSTGKSRSYLLSSNRFAKSVLERLHKTNKVVYKEDTFNLCRIYLSHVLESGLEWKDGNNTYEFTVYIFDEIDDDYMILAFTEK